MQFIRDIVDVVRDSGVRFVLSLIYLTPGRPGNATMDSVRRLLLLLIGVQAGGGSQVSPGFRIFKRGGVKFGDNCRIGYSFQIWNFRECIVGDNLLASHGISVICGNHTVDLIRLNIPGPVTIGNNVWIGANVTIVGPCTIEDNVIIGANSFVTGCLKSNGIYGGSPARLIREI